MKGATVTKLLKQVKKDSLLISNKILNIYFIKTYFPEKLVIKQIKQKQNFFMKSKTKL